ncbi:MAG TPA: META domain-containing protein [Candidatus Limnocylindrales bacterium]|jgi:heat shock protein HslJ|nr:META domain-containing protein [Candidatus Limnocylindrales bacterium]
MTRRRLGFLAALAVLLPLLSACAPATGDGGTLEGTRWVLDSYADETGTLAIVPETIYADAEFAAHRISGFAGCNEFGGLYRAGGRTLFVSNLASSLMACDEETSAFEQTYLGLLDQSRFYTARRDTLTIYGAGRTPLLRFDAAPRNPLLGAWVVGSIGDDAGTVRAPVEGSELEVVFRIGTVGGFAGCNSFSGVYGTNGNAMWVSPLALTRIACDEALMTQESAFVSALEGVAFIEDRGSQVNLTDRKGNLRLALVDPRSIPAPSPEPTASPEGSASPSESPTSTPTEEPTPTPTPSPTPTPTAKPTASPTASPTAPPTIEPPPSIAPPTATCDLATPDGVQVATVVYPGTWFTLTDPASAACRYFDPQPIDPPTDGTAPKTVVQADSLTASYLDAVAAATDSATWDVESQSEVQVGGVPITCVLATATDESAAGVAVGTTRYQCLANVGSAGTVVIWTDGAPAASQGQPPSTEFLEQMAVVSLMVGASTFFPPA